MITQVVLNDSGTLVPKFSVNALNPEERKRLFRFAEVLSESHQGVILRRARRLTIGRTVIRNVVLVSPPPMATEDFLSFLHIALGSGRSIALPMFAAGGGETWQTGTPDAFIVAMAALLVEESERVLRAHLSRGYVSITERRTILSGRPLWTRDFGRHPAQGISCLTNKLTTNTIHNRLVLNGLLVARKLLEATVLRERVENQVFIWRALATPQQVSSVDFDVAARRANRLTDHYGPVLALSRAIVTGAGMPDVFTSGGLTNIHFELSLPGLFEQLLIQLLEPLEKKGLVARFKCVDSGAFLDGDGSTYRQIEPDITIWRNGLPVAVIDAKFKPRYLRAQPNGSVAPPDRVTNEDLYQLFFYQSRLQAVHRLVTPPAAFIVAPIVNGSVMPTQSARTIQWKGNEGGASVLRVESINIPRLTQLLRSGETEDLIYQACPSLVAQLLSVVENVSSSV